MIFVRQSDTRSQTISDSFVFSKNISEKKVNWLIETSLSPLIREKKPRMKLDFYQSKKGLEFGLKIITDPFCN